LGYQNKKSKSDRRNPKWLRRSYFTEFNKGLFSLHLTYLLSNTNIFLSHYKYAKIKILINFKKTMKKIILLLLLSFLIMPFQVKAAGGGLSERLKGRILLQVEEKGEAWYVNPLDLERYFLGRPADAFRLMRELGLGVSEADFSKWNGTAPSRLAGRIILRVQGNGEAYYIEPAGLKLHYLGRPADAFSLMRNLGLGITNANLNLIRIRSSHGIPTIPTTPSMPAVPPLPEMPAEPIGGGDEQNIDENDEDSNLPNTEENNESEPIQEECVFTADYFINNALSGFPYASRQETEINHQWGSEAPEALGNRYDLFSVRWTGECYFEAGDYEFTAVFDDAIKAYFNDTEWIFNNWKDNGRVVEMSHTRTVKEGYHKIKVEYYENKHNAEINFGWRKVE
jgi:hypothetical protein